VKKQEIIAKAKNQYQKLLKQKKDPRVQETLGKLVYAGLLKNINCVPVPGPVDLTAALLTGDIEPRVLELLPALLLKKPKLITGKNKMPDDLKETLFAIVRGQTSKPFRGVAPQDFLKWIKILGHRQKSGHFMKSFRFRPEDQQLLQSLKHHREESDISVIRRALEHLRKE